MSDLLTYGEYLQVSPSSTHVDAYSYASCVLLQLTDEHHPNAPKLMLLSFVGAVRKAMGGMNGVEKVIKMLSGSALVPYNAGQLT